MIRKGSLDGLAEEVGDRALLELALEDYRLSRRRDRASRKDYVMGWVAAVRRLRSDEQMQRKVLRDLTLVA